VQTTCGQLLQQSLPQDAEHFALALYDDNTTCSEVREPTERLYKQYLKLDFVHVVEPIAQRLSYQTCTDTTWEAVREDKLTSTETIGPVDTYVFWFNPCNTTEVITYNISRLADSTSPHCSKSRPDCSILDRHDLLGCTHISRAHLRQCHASP
jgi:hypothetical protein